MLNRRALHYVFKIGDRKESLKFYREILGMKILRHEEFDEGCQATCNGPYDGKWSKTMIGYGPEDNHFVCELTYNYGISHYTLGNDFLGLYIQSSEAVLRAHNSDFSLTQDGNSYVVKSPGGYPFFLIDLPQPTDRGCPVDHAEGFGRIAFSCPNSELKSIEDKMKEKEGTILTPFVSLETPGKATVHVVILADPDGHEICFVGDEGFRELSQVDPKAEELLNEALLKDKSDEWFPLHRQRNPLK